MGVLSLWDRRFGLLLKSWQVRHTSAGKSTRIYQCVVHPTKGRGKWVIVALDASKASADRVPITLIEVWDIEKSSLVETFVMKTASTSSDSPAEEPQEVNGLEAEPNPAAAIAALVRSRQGGTNSKLTKRAQSSSSSIPQEDQISFNPSLTMRTIVVGSEFGGHQSGYRAEMHDLTGELNTQSRSLGRGFMISGSEDRRLRLWDLGKLERTSVLSGIDSEHEKPSYRCVARFPLIICAQTNNLLTLLPRFKHRPFYLWHSLCPHRDMA